MTMNTCSEEAIGRISPNDMSPWCTGAAFLPFWKKIHIYSLPITARALKLTLLFFFFPFETKMESGQKQKHNLREVNSSQPASFAGGWKLLSNFSRNMTAKLRQLTHGTWPRVDSSYSRRKSKISHKIVVFMSFLAQKLHAVNKMYKLSK